MPEAPLKAKLKKLIDREKNDGVLELVGRVLERRTRTTGFKSALVKRVVRSEEDLIRGRSNGLDAFERNIDEFLDGLLAPKPRVRSRRRS